MPRETSLYLDIIRFAAALTVFLSHFSYQNISGGLFWRIKPYGPEAVIVFFVLSGFVIAYVSDTREQSATSYATARAARIYSVALPALVITFILDSMGNALRPDLYAWLGVSNGIFQRYFLSFLFLHQIWSLDLIPGSNLPYWSLGYEVWYYVIFGIGLFLPRKWCVIGICSALAIVGIGIAAFLPVWLLGVFAYRVSKNKIVRPGVGALLCFGALIGWIVYEVVAWHYDDFSIDFMPSVIRKPLVQYYVVGMLFASHLVGFDSICHATRRILCPMTKMIRWLAGATFSIYLFHYPITRFILAVDPWPVSSWLSRITVLFGTLIAVFLLAEVTERRKYLWVPLFERFFSALALLLQNHALIRRPRKATGS